MTTDTLQDSGTLLKMADTLYAPGIILMTTEEVGLLRMACSQKLGTDLELLFPETARIGVVVTVVFKPFKCKGREVEL